VQVPGVQLGNVHNICRYVVELPTEITAQAGPDGNSYDFTARTRRNNLGNVHDQTCDDDYIVELPTGLTARYHPDGNSYDLCCQHNV
jgi:hypothetical protein